MSLQPDSAPSRPAYVRDSSGLYYKIGGGSSSGGGSGGSSVLGSKFVSVTDHGAVGNGTTNDVTAIKAAITAAGPGGTVYFPMTTGDYMINASVKPLDRQRWVGQVYPRYWIENPDTLPGARGRLRAMASFTGNAVIYNDVLKTNGIENTGSYGVSIEHMGIVGNAEDGSVDGVDLGPSYFGECAWHINGCQITWCSTAISGHLHVVTVRECSISRNGWGIAPHRGADNTSPATDCLFIDNFIYFNKHHAIELNSSSNQCGMISIIGNRMERSGVDPDSPGGATRDPNACGIYLGDSTGISIVSNTTDANTGPGLRVAGPSNNVVISGNVFKRDGIGNNTSTMSAGVAFKDAGFVTAVGNAVTYGTPDDSGSGRIAPQYGVEFDSCNFVNWTGTVDLSTDVAIDGYKYLSTIQPNWRVFVSDVAQSAPAAYHIAVDTPNGEEANVSYRTSGAYRWTAGKAEGVEGTGNTGASFTIARWDNTGAWIDNPVEILRDTGVVVLQKPLWLVDKVPTAPEHAASKQYVDGKSGVSLSSTAPAALGVAAVGVGTTAARADHVHVMPTPANIGLPKITVSTTAPSSPATGDVWIDTN
jgi:parallel beta-helix repeat protein